jgi:hypothetical protein
MLFSELENDTSGLKFKLNQAELLNEIKIKCSRFLDKLKIGCPEHTTTSSLEASNIRLDNRITSMNEQSKLI